MMRNSHLIDKFPKTENVNEDPKFANLTFKFHHSSENELFGRNLQIVLHFHGQMVKRTSGQTEKRTKGKTAKKQVDN